MGLEIEEGGAEEEVKEKIIPRVKAYHTTKKNRTFEWLILPMKIKKNL